MLLEKYVKVGKGGQIIIPTEMREHEGIKTGDSLKLTSISGEISIRRMKAKAVPEKRIYEILREARFTEKDWQETIRERREE